MKAWDDIKRMHTVYTTRTTEWWLDRGCKIEHFIEDNRFEVKNVMTESDHYDDVSTDLMEVFKNNGWNDGTALLNIRVNQMKIDKVQRLMDDARCTDESRERLNREKDKFLQKIYQHSQNLSNNFVHLKTQN